MQWSIHHINVPVHDVQQSRVFYRDVIGLSDGPTPKTIGAGAGVFERSTEAYDLLGDGDGGLHIMKPIATFATDNKLAINPTITGHFAIRVSDLDAVRHRLRKAGVFFCDAGDFSMPGVRQIYLYDPSMNCIEINQAG